METLFLSYMMVEEERTYGLTNQRKTKLVLKLLAICVDKLVFPAWFLIFLLIKC